MQGKQKHHHHAKEWLRLPRGWERGTEATFPESSEGSNLGNLLISAETSDLQDNGYLLLKLVEVCYGTSALGKPVRKK
ncbi:hypothetical protein LEMLEM_LOCUS21451 [Lemmus lemmus]